MTTEYRERERREQGGGGGHQTCIQQGTNNPWSYISYDTNALTHHEEALRISYAYLARGKYHSECSIYLLRYVAVATTFFTQSDDTGERDRDREKGHGADSLLMRHTSKDTTYHTKSREVLLSFGFHSR